MYYSYNTHNSWEWWVQCLSDPLPAVESGLYQPTLTLKEVITPCHQQHFMTTAALHAVITALTVNSGLPSHSFFSLTPPLGLKWDLSGVQGQYK